MINTYYDVMFLLSLGLTGVYMLIWHKHFDVHISLLFLLIPIINMSYTLLCRAQTLEAALAAQKLTYLGGCFQLLLIMFTVFSLCHIPLNRWLRFGFLAVSSLVFISAMTIGQNSIFYRSVAIERTGPTTVLVNKEYGPMHTVFYVMAVVFFLITLSAIIYSYLKKKQVSRKTLTLLFLPVIIAMISFFGGRQIIPRVELLPAAYVFAQIVYLIIVYRMCLYDVTDTAVDSLVEKGDTGLISFDFKCNYLGSNETAKAVFPDLTKLTVDRPLQRSPELSGLMLPWIDSFREKGDQISAHYEKGDKIYQADVNYLFDGHRRRGYQLIVTDDTQDQQYIKLLDSFNAELKNEVAQKTAHIVEMHDQLILGMATMVESRDNSTGGHIRRTSEGVRLLIEEMRRDGACALSSSFCKNIIKAAPMHDLGKIAVDDQILRKPGRFTPEEFEKMKAHAAEGARIVHEILKGTDDEDFRRIAENVAHYHHERWDGSGYPDGLKGEEIPLEARIMAVADVYDALVSKRVYKDSMSFSQADAIIMDGMGKHFDPSLQPCYVAARPKLEAYYGGLE